MITACCADCLSWLVGCWVYRLVVGYTDWLCGYADWLCGVYRLAVWVYRLAVWVYRLAVWVPVDWCVMADTEGNLRLLLNSLNHEDLVTCVLKTEGTANVLLPTSLQAHLSHTHQRSTLTNALIISVPHGESGKSDWKLGLQLKAPGQSPLEMVKYFRS